ncbi:MAG: tyrosine-type recombinase/integrase [Planctomycetales bacterium]
MGRPASIWFWKGRGFATDAGGRRRLLVKGPRTKANRDLAHRKLAELLGEESLQSVRGRPATLAEVIDRFLADCEARLAAGELKPSTMGSSYRPYAALLKKECGDWTVPQIGKQRVRQYRAQLATRHLSDNTLRNRLSLLRTILRWAARHALVPRSQSEAVVSLPPRRRRERIPTRPEIERLIDAARADVADVLRFLLNEPVRPGDAFDLTVGSVDLAQGLIHLADSKTGPRTFPIVADPVAPLLERRIADKAPYERVFTTVSGRPWRRDYFAELVRAAREAAGLGSNVVAYSIRHRWTTDAFLNGVPLNVVRALRNDCDIKTTLAYEHAADQEGFLRAAAHQAIGRPRPAAD